MNLSLTAIAFRIINFVLFIYGAWYLFKKYARQSIEDEIAQQEASQERLIDRHGALEESIELLKADQDSLKRTVKDLSEKINIWKNQVDKKNRIQENENKHREEQLTKTVHTQQTVYKEGLLQKAAMQGAIADVKNQVRQSITATNAASQMQRIIKSIAK